MKKNNLEIKSVKLIYNELGFDGNPISVKLKRNDIKDLVLTNVISDISFVYGEKQTSYMCDKFHITLRGKAIANSPQELDILECYSLKEILIEYKEGIKEKYNLPVKWATKYLNEANTEIINKYQEIYYTEYNDEITIEVWKEMEE